MKDSFCKQWFCRRLQVRSFSCNRWVSLYYLKQIWHLLFHIELSTHLFPVIFNVKRTLSSSRNFRSSRNSSIKTWCTIEKKRSKTTDGLESRRCFLLCQKKLELSKIVWPPILFISSRLSLATLTFLYKVRIWCEFHCILETFLVIQKSL